MSKILVLCGLALIFAQVIVSSNALHLQGTWETDSFFLFLAKFGFQKTERNNKNDTQGYIFGNITSSKDATWTVSIKPSRRLVKRDGNAAITKVVPTNSSLLPSKLSSTPKPSTPPIPQPSISSSSSSTKMKTAATAGKEFAKSSSSSSTTVSPSSASSKSPPPHSSSIPPVTKFTVFPATLVVLDRGYFVDFYRARNNPDRDAACREMFEHISRVAHDPVCFKEGIERLYKRVPCTKGQLCIDDNNNFTHVVKEHQFTFEISDPNQPKFWYVSLVACYRDPETCEWKHSGNPVAVNYDVWLVNGNPYTKNQNPLEYQFSFDRQDTVEVYLVFFVCYLILFPLQVHAVIRQRHIVPRLFTGSVVLELAAVLANVVDVLKFSVNGVGHPSLAAFGDVMDIAARAIFMLILLVLAKGWAVTRTELKSKPFIFTIWTLYGVVHILLYVWKETEVDVIEDIDEYQTWPGWLILILRNVIMIWFLYELKDTMDHEHQPHKLNFFLHFGAASLVWFIYLPIIALIALQVTPLWRSKLLLGITYSADCFAFAVMTHLLWPTRSQQYFLLTAKDITINDELEEFNEAPHVVNSARRHNLRQPTFFGRDSNSNNRSSFNGAENGLNGSTLYDDYKDNAPLIVT